jgi:DnaK suppressor protein
MTRNELKRFQGILMARHAELEDAVRNREALAIDTSHDELDRVQQAAEREMAIDNLERQSDRLHEVESALRRIDAGTFGTCLDCEENISLKRLAAVPWTGSCIGCQQTADRNSLEPWNAIEGASVFEGPLMHAA